MIKGIIFDLDGTLIDSMKIWTKIDRRLLRENGVENIPPDISDRVRKMTIEESAQYFIDEFRLECTIEYIIKRIEELVRTEYEENIPLKPYAKEILDFLDEKGVPYGKNFPDIFLGGAKRLGSEPEEVLVVEDSLHCIETAAKAGFVTAGIYDEVSWNEQSLIADMADHYVRSLKELEVLFK